MNIKDRLRCSVNGNTGVGAPAVVPVIGEGGDASWYSKGHHTHNDATDKYAQGAGEVPTNTAIDAVDTSIWWRQRNYMGQHAPWVMEGVRGRPP